MSFRMKSSSPNIRDEHEYDPTRGDQPSAQLKCLAQQAATEDARRKNVSTRQTVMAQNTRQQLAAKGLLEPQVSV